MVQAEFLGYAHAHARTCTWVAAYPVSICYDTTLEAKRHTVESAQTNWTQHNNVTQE